MRSPAPFSLGTLVPLVSIVSIVSIVLLAPMSARAQESWTGIGAIGGTAMYMDTTTIVRTGTLRKVWIRSVDREPRKLVAGSDTISFDAVTGLNEFDCARATRTVTSVQYFLHDELVLDISETHGAPEPVRPKSFFGAVYADVCRDRR